MGFWLTLFLWAAVTAIGELLRPRPRFGVPQPSGIGDFNLPTAQEGRAVPVAFGTVHVKGPNVVWYGDLVVSPITKRVKTGLFSSTRVTTGYRYFLGLHLVLCHGPVDDLLEVRFDDRAIPGGSLSVTADNNAIVFNNGVSWFTASIPVGPYSNLTSLARAGQDAMQAVNAQPWRVVYGYEVVAGQTDQVIYAVRVTGGAATNRTATIVVGIYETGADFAAAVAAAINAVEAVEPGGARIRVDPAFDGARFTFTAYLLRPGFDAWILRGAVADYNVSAMPCYGFQMGVDKTMLGFPSSYTSEFLTGPKRFMFAFSGLAGLLGLANANGIFSSAGLFGLATGANVTIQHHMAENDRDLPGITFYSQTDLINVLINQPNLFGGQEREGGVIGTIDFYKGTLTQTANAYLQSVLGVDLPAYRGVCHAVLRGGPRGGVGFGGGLPLPQLTSGMYLGTSPYLKPISFVVRATPNTLGLVAGRQNIGGDANPACMLYEILTNTRWGLAIPAGQIYTASFVAAGDALYAESLGLSMLIDQQAAGFDLVGEILRHIDGVIYTDPESGLLSLKLARADYVVASLPVLDQSNAELTKLSRPSWDDLKNVVKVRYLDRAANFSDRVAQAQDLSQIDLRGGEVSEEDFPFRGISNAAAAQKRAASLLKTVAYPLAPFQAVANRQLAKLRPGDVVRLNWPNLGILNMVARVTRLRDGEVRDGKIVVDGVEDVFAVDWTAYPAPAASGWVDPISPPAPLSASALVECPYGLVIGADRLVLTLGARPASGGLVLGYQVWSDPAGGGNYALSNEVLELTPSALLAGGGLGYVETTLLLASPVGMALLTSAAQADFKAGTHVLLVDQEFVAWQFITANSDGTFTISGCVRGVLDTTPVPHAPGARVWFVTAGAGLASEEAYQADLTLKARLLPFNSLGAVQLGDAVEVSLTTNSRAQRPYVPSAVQVNSLSYPSLISGALTVSWSHRNRLGEWSHDDAGATASPEPGTTYTLRLYGEDGSLDRTYSGLTGTSQTWTTETADSGLGRLNNVVRIELEAVVAGVVSFQLFNFTVWRDIVAPSMGHPAPRHAMSRRRRQRVARVMSSDPGE